MAKGINLSLTKSLANFDALLDEAIGAVSVKRLTVPPELYELNVWKLQIGKYARINDEEMDEAASADEEDIRPIFWIGYGWEENDNRQSMLWLEFDARTCLPEYWEKLMGLVGTSGKYCSTIEFEFVQVYMNAWIHFYLAEEYLKQFYDENADPNAQREIITAFINEVLEKIQTGGPVALTEKISSRKSIPLPALERLSVIDRAIASGKYPNSNDLVECLRRACGECKPASVTTVGRDIAFMKDRLRAPIEYDTRERGYCYTQKDFRLWGAFDNATH